MADAEFSITMHDHIDLASRQCLPDIGGACLIPSSKYSSTTVSASVTTLFAITAVLNMYLCTFPLAIMAFYG